MRRRVLACAVALLAGCSLAPEKGPDPRDARIAELEARTAQLEGVLQGQGLAELNRQVEQLQAEVRRLRGSLEEQQFAVEGQRKQQRDQYADLDTRLQALEKAGAAAATPAVPPDEAAYRAAFDLMKAGNYDDAQKALEAFLATWPASTLAENAQYWLGEVYFLKKAWWPAHGAFNKVLAYRDGRKAPDALVKRGYVEYELKRYQSARKTLESVLARYPDTQAARDARERLKRMKAEGH